MFLLEFFLLFVFVFFLFKKTLSIYYTMMLKPQPRNPNWHPLMEERIFNQEEFSCKVTMGFGILDFSVYNRSAFCSLSAAPLCPILH